ncbi:hypothetical protein UR09_01140 [Candidatus Nitromaritima sp. SCGC AAA799-A02]|nr:hypothetical protein UR09_01140 [Candidatus Nitromaritima sp. SCGC AAA799-A02]
MDPIVQKVRQAVNRMVSSGDRILAAVSGGPDSVVMLHLLKEMMSGTPGFGLAVAHLNHLAREKDSDEDAAFVARLGERLGLETFIEEIDVAEEKNHLKTSFQEAGRLVRHEFLERVREQWGGTRIALGHTADDQAETVLMNLLRGSGSRGLAGIPPVRERFIRPLHDCFRHEVEAYIESQRLDFRSDETNRETNYLRNRVRLELIPFLERYNPLIKSTLIETSRILGDDEECLQALVGKLYDEAAGGSAARGLPALDIHSVKAQHPALQKRLVRQAIREARGSLRRIAARHVHDVLGLFHSPETGKEIHLPGGLAAVCEGKTVVFRKNPSRENSILTDEETGDSPAMEIKVPGWTDLGTMGLRLHATLMSKEEFSSPPLNPCQACLDFDKTGSSIRVRFFRPGDRFVPLGMKGTKKLKSFFIDEKVPREERGAIPLLTTRDDNIIWVYEKRIADIYRVTDKTRNILLVEGVAG